MVSSSIFKVFGMTRPWIEPRSPGPLANTLTAGPITLLKYSFLIFSFIYVWKSLLPVFPSSCNFLPSKNSDTCLVWQFYSNLFLCSYFPLTIISKAHFSTSTSIPISWFYTFIVCLFINPWVFFTRVWCFGLVSLFNGISTLCRLFNAKAIL